MAKLKIIDGQDIGLRIAEALGLEHTRRIILDIGIDQPAVIYVEFYGDERLYNIDFSGLKMEIVEEEAE